MASPVLNVAQGHLKLLLTTHGCSPCAVCCPSATRHHPMWRLIKIGQTGSKLPKPFGNHGCPPILGSQQALVKELGCILALPRRSAYLLIALGVTDFPLSSTASKPALMLISQRACVRIVCLSRAGGAESCGSVCHTGLLLGWRALRPATTQRRERRDITKRGRRANLTDQDWERKRHSLRESNRPLRCDSG